MKDTTAANLAFYRYRDATSTDTMTASRQRLQDAWRMYAGVNLGQWHPDVAKQLTELRMPAHTYNFAQQAVDTICGHLLQSPIDCSISTRVPSDTDEVSAMQSLMDTDFQACNFDLVEQRWQRDSLIHHGILQIGVDTDTDPLGRIYVTNRDPNFFYASPSWVTEDFADCDECFVSEWLTPAQIKAAYGTKSEEIDELIVQQQESASSGSWWDEADKVAERSPDFYDRNRNRYRVIERHWIAEKSERVVIDLWTHREVPGKKPSKVSDAAPDVVWEAALNAEYSAEQGTDPKKRYVVKRKRVRKSMITTICPALGINLELANGEYPVQCGQLPFTIWSFGQAHGERWGAIELIKDVQATLNVRLSQITKMANNKVNNSLVVESDAFDDDAQRNSFRTNAQKPGYVHIVAPGTNQAQKIRPLNDGTDMSDLLQTSNLHMQMMRDLLNVVPMMNNPKKVGHDSGVLYESTRADSLIPFEKLLESYKSAKRKLVELYIKAALDWYGTAPRIFWDTARNVQVSLNIPMATPTGEIKETKLGDASWYQIDMVMLRVGNARREQMLGQYQMLLKSTEVPAVRGLIQREIVNLLQVPEEAKAEIFSAIDEFVKAQNAMQSAQAAEAQAKAAQAAMAAQPQPQAPPQMLQAAPYSEQMMGAGGGA